METSIRGTAEHCRPLVSMGEREQHGSSWTAASAERPTGHTGKGASTAALCCGWCESPWSRARSGSSCGMLTPRDAWYTCVADAPYMRVAGLSTERELTQLVPVCQATQPQMQEAR